MSALRGLWAIAVTFAAYQVGRREGRDQGQRAAWTNAAAVFAAGVREGRR